MIIIILKCLCVLAWAGSVYFLLDIRKTAKSTRKMLDNMGYVSSLSTKMHNFVFKIIGYSVGIGGTIGLFYAFITH